MKKLFIITIMLTLSGCASFGRGVAEAFLEQETKIDTRQCEIRGKNVHGIDDFFKNSKVTKVLMIHGVGTHDVGYSARIRKNLADALNLRVLSRIPKNITLINPDDGKSVIGYLQVTRMQDENKSRELLFYELTWSTITNQDKSMLAYDYSGEYSYKRSAFNQTMKKFLNDVMPDPMVYVIDKKHTILRATQQSTCWMLGNSWKQLPSNAKKVCKVASAKQIANLNHENIVLITHSLGSRILMDSMTDIVEYVTNLEIKNNPKATPIIEQLKNKDMTVFMLANQLPILQIGKQVPQVHNQTPQYCSPKGKHYNDRVFNKFKIVAFSDPNDLLSYDIPQSFVDNYIDSRLCPEVTNVNINIAEEISAFGIGVVNPMAAHTEYDNDERVINIIAHGFDNTNDNNIVTERCSFYQLED